MIISSVFEMNSKVKLKFNEAFFDFLITSKVYFVYAKSWSSQQLGSCIMCIIFIPRIFLVVEDDSPHCKVLGLIFIQIVWFHSNEGSY